MFRPILMTLVLTITANISLAEEMPAKLREQIDKNYIGKWSFKLTSDDGVVEGTLTARWARGKHCVLVNQTGKTPDGAVHEAGILAWQPDRKTLVHHGFMSTGDYFTITYDKFEGNTWSGRVTGLVNGEPSDESEASVVWNVENFIYKDDVFKYEAKRQKEAK